MLQAYSDQADRLLAPELAGSLGCATRCEAWRFRHHRIASMPAPAIMARRRLLPPDVPARLRRRVLRNPNMSHLLGLAAPRAFHCRSHADRRRSHLAPPPGPLF